MLKLLQWLPFINHGVAFISGLGPLALLGIPGAGAVAWIGSKLASPAIKLACILIGVGALLILTGVLAVHIDNLEHDRAAYRLQTAMVDGLKTAHGCNLRPPQERGLDACLAAEARDIEHARADKLAELQAQAARAQADLDAANASNSDLAAQIEDLISRSAATGDGPVPKVLLDTWARARAARGVK